MNKTSYEWSPVELSLMPFLSDRGVYKSWLNKNKYIKQQVYREKEKLERRQQEVMQSIRHITLPTPNIQISRLLTSEMKGIKEEVNKEVNKETSINNEEMKEIDNIVEKEIDDILNTAYDDLALKSSEQTEKITVSNENLLKQNAPKARKEKTCIEIEDIFAYKKPEERPLKEIDESNMEENNIEEENTIEGDKWCIL